MKWTYEVDPSQGTSCSICAPSPRQLEIVRGGCAQVQVHEPFLQATAPTSGLSFYLHISSYLESQQRSATGFLVH